MAVRPHSELRILAFAGLRLDTSFPWAAPDAGQAARAERLQALDAIGAIAASEADVLVSAGDLYDQDRHHPDTGELLRQAFGGLGMPVVLVPGQSDPPGRLSLYERIDWPDNVHLLGVEDDPQPFEAAAGLTIWGAATAEAFDRFVSPGLGIHLGLTRWPPPQEDRPGLHHLISGLHHEPLTSPRFTCPGAAQPYLQEDEAGSAALISVFDDGTVAVGWRDLGGAAPAAPSHRFSSQDLHEFELALLGEEQTVRGELVRNLLAAVEIDPHVRRLALLSGLRALAGVKPLVGSQSAGERNGGRH